MKKIATLLLVWSMALGALYAETTPQHTPKKMMKLFQSVPLEKASIVQKGDAKHFCPECGMTLAMFFKTNHAAQVDGNSEQFCSLHCLVDVLNQGKKVDHIEVVDTKTLQFIPAIEAFYVVGSKQKGTMTMVSKYAFLKRSDAEAFAKKNGGTIMDFQGALAIAKKDFEKERKMIAKKQKMMAQKGQKIYSKMCQPTIKVFDSVADAKAFVSGFKLCKSLNGKQLQAVGLYLKNR